MAPAPLLSDSAGDINGLVPKKVDTTYVVTGKIALGVSSSSSHHIDKFYAYRNLYARRIK